MVSFIFTATGGSAAIVAPFGGKARRMSTNPFAMAVPSGREFPVVFDMATSVIANGKLRVAKDAVKGVTPGLIIDKDGNPSTDALDVERGGAILPLGGADKGYKGYLMGFLVEVLGGLLTGGGFQGQGQGKEQDPLFSNPSCLIAIDVERFRPLGLFQQELEQLIAYLKSTPTAPGGEVLAPGEVEERHERQRRRDGIALPEQTVTNLQSELDRYGVRMKLESLALG
jgi:LDH2 family malate/lactate/ureidoglycolate dehydrogenase